MNLIQKKNKFFKDEDIFMDMDVDLFRPLISINKLGLDIMQIILIYY